MYHRGSVAVSVTHKLQFYLLLFSVLITSVKSLTSCCGSCFYLSGTMFPCCPCGTCNACYHLRFYSEGEEEHRERERERERESGREWECVREKKRGRRRGRGGVETEKRISSSQDFIWLFGQIGRIQNAAGACDVAMKRLPLIPPHYFFLPCTCARQNQLDQLWRGEAAAHPHNKPLHHLSLPTIWLLFSLSTHWYKLRRRRHLRAQQTSRCVKDEMVHK